jgi:hypothetical protein
VPSDHPNKVQLLALLKSSSSSSSATPSKQKKKNSGDQAGSGGTQPSFMTGPPQVQAFQVSL